MKNIAVTSMAACLILVSAAPAQLTFNPTPSREVGQPSLATTSASPNFVEGREFSSPQSLAIDTSASPPILYVSDSGNHRVLGFRNASAFTNGAKADIVIGQKDRFSTLVQGPGTSLNSGLASPTGIAVDAQGNVYVVDTGNNRILRYPKPASLAPGELQIPDFVIGQKNLTTKAPNAGGISASTVWTAGNSGPFRTTLLFDSNGNLWFTDAGNNRVLRYPAASLNGPNGPEADIVLGQLSFTTNSVPPAPQPPLVNARQVKTGLFQPSGLAFDQAGRLFVSDGFARVLVYTPPFAIGSPASRVLGVVLPVGTAQPPTLNESTLGVVSSSNVIPPEGVFMVGNSPAVIDTGNHRVVRFDPYDTWPTEAQVFSPPAKQVLGQIDFVSNKANSGQPSPNDGSLSGPVQGVVFNNELFLADSGNNRVLVFPLQSGFFSRASRLLGQDYFYQNAINLIEGREFFFSLGTFLDAAGLVVDSKSDPPRLYVADTYNNRVLGFKDARNVRPGDAADLVIGQPDLTRQMANFPKNQTDTPQENTLFLPRGLAVDRDGSLWVADGGNARVLRFPAPFDQPAGMPKANLVLGQTSFFTQVTDATSRTMRSPYGLALTQEGHLLVSDAVHNRVLFFRRPPGGDFITGQSAENVFGQPDSLKTEAGNQLNQMSAPRHIATDADDHLYVADTGNGRVLVFDRATNAGPNPTAAVPLGGLSSPVGVFVSKSTGEVWITEAGANRVSRFPSYDRLLAQPKAEATLASFGPLAVTLDGFGNLVVAESINRVIFFFPGLQVQNAANFSLRPLAPGSIASLFPQSNDLNAFGTETKVFEKTPLPTDLADVQVLFNDKELPLFFVSNRQINFTVPMSAPSSGTAEITVMRRTSGQILASGQVALAPASPGLFTTNGAGTGQLAALNVKANGSTTPNSPADRVAWGETVVLFGTGQGFLSGAPPDGEPATGTTQTDEKPKIWIGTDFVSPENVTYSGLAPGLVGVWQINFKVPDNVVPSPAVQCFVILKSVPSNQGPNGILVTTLAVKQP